MTDASTQYLRSIAISVVTILGAMAFAVFAGMLIDVGVDTYWDGSDWVEEWTTAGYAGLIVGFIAFLFLVFGMFSGWASYRSGVAAEKRPNT